tara:strand:+ start:2628 stop:3260 length:633 start_codon:yes stop_codon:yes gene_type:complete
LINIVDNIDSTNTWLTQFNNDFFDSIISFKQSKGYGRLGRHWESDIGGLYYSVVLPYRKILPIIVGVSVSEILVKYKLDIRLKWPNDILVDGKKLGGILCQSNGKSSIVGLGINLHNNPKLSESINLSELNCNINKLIFVDNLSKKISVLLKCKDQEIIDKFLAYDCLIGRFVSWSEGKGLVEKISNEGYLVVRDTNDKVVFLTDEVHLE